MAKESAKTTQKTKPKKGKPAEIPVPTRKQFFSDLKKAAKPRKK